MTDIFFHEDDYCQIEILPSSGFDASVAIVDEINKFAEAHRSGIGYTDMYMRPENRFKFADFKVHRDDFEALIQDCLPSIPRVLTGYSTHSEECQLTAAFGHDGYCAIFIDWDDEMRSRTSGLRWISSRRIRSRTPFRRFV